MKAVVMVTDKLIAPLAKGAEIGAAKINYNGKPIAGIPVVALEEVPQSEFFARLINSAHSDFPDLRRRTKAPRTIRVVYDGAHMEWLE